MTAIRPPVTTTGDREPPVTVHDLRGTDDEAPTPRSVAKALRDVTSVHVLLLGDTSRTAAEGETLVHALTDHAAAAAPIVAVATGTVRGAELAWFASADLRTATSGTTFGWGDDAIVPGLGAVLASRCGWPVTMALAWGELLSLAGARDHGLVDRGTDDLTTALGYVTDRISAVGFTTLRHRARSLRAWRATGDLSSSVAFDRHLGAIAADDSHAS